LKSVLELLLLAVYCDFTVWFEYLQWTSKQVCLSVWNVK
jgi:hypothetical protein